MKIHFLGSNRTINGARTLLQTPDNINILIDIGMAQSNGGNFKEVLDWNGREFEFDIDKLDYVILTHGHIDHVGLLPLLFKRGFKGEIISTVPTAKFCSISLPDSANIMARDCEIYNKNHSRSNTEPLYNEDEARGVIPYIQGYSYNTPIVLSDNVKVELLEAGHMLGACMPKITYRKGYNKTSVVFTGDTSALNKSHPFLGCAGDLGDIDYVVCESTYGNRTHDNVDIQQVLADEIEQTCVQNGKTLLLPVFAMQRSSEILWHLREVYLKNKHFYNIPIYLDSPMAVKSQLIVDDCRSYWADKWLKRDEMLGNLFTWEVLQYVYNYQMSQRLKNNNSKIILSSSGMCSGGRVLHHLENFLPHKGNTVLFTGHQVEGSLGYNLLHNKGNSFAINNNQVTRRANVKQVKYSSHADKNQLVELLKTSKKGKLKRVFLVHGDLPSSKSLKKQIERELKVKTIVPKYSSIYKLS